MERFVAVGMLIFSIILFVIYLGMLYSLLATKVPYVPTFDSEIRLMKKELSLSPGKIVDLGCGDGKALRMFEKLGFHGVGYDINRGAIMIGKVINRRSKSDIRLVRKNFKGIFLQEFDYIYVYLLPEYLEKIEDRIFSQMGDDTIIISNSFRFSAHEPYEIIYAGDRPRIYLYKKTS